MRTIFAALGTLLFVLFFTVSAQANPPVEAFGNLPEFSQPQISPDGKHLAALQSLKGRPVIVIYKLDAPPGEQPSIVRWSEGLLVGLRWAKNDRLIILAKMVIKVPGDDRMRSWVRLLSVDAEGKNAVVLLNNVGTLGNNTSSANVVDLAPDDPSHIFTTLFNRTMSTKSYAQDPNGETLFRLDLMKVDVQSGVGHTTMAGEYNTSEWFTDGNGAVVARIDVKQNPRREQIKLYENGSWKDGGIYDATGDSSAGLIGLTEDGHGLAMLGQDETGNKILISRNLKDGQTAVLFSAPRFDTTEAVTDPWTGRVIGAGFADDKPQTKYFDKTNQALQNGLEKAFPNTTVRAISYDRSRNRVVVRVEAPRTPTTYYLLDRTNHTATALQSAYPGLTEADLGEMKPYPYKARDGLDIPAYLTLPPGKAANNLPTIIMPHGGPDSRDSLGFDWWAQFLANRGYAVLQPNYRGSSGYGRAFTQAGLQQWGLKMQDDISDGVQKLIADGIADPKRICIVGASYGGYAALAGATLTPQLYACAASFAGLSDLPKMLLTERSDHGRNSYSVSFWTSRIGSAYDDSERLRATSPAYHADKVTCPILLMHGEGDTTVRINQSQIMHDALKAANKDVQFIRFEGEDHYLNLAATRIAMLTALEAFLKKNIGG